MYHSVDSELENEYEIRTSNYPVFLYKFGLFLFPYIVSNPFQVALIFQQVQYTPSVLSKKSIDDICPSPPSEEPLETRLLEADAYCQETSQIAPSPLPLPVDSLGYVEAPKEKVIGTCVLEDGSLLSTVIVGSKGITSVDLTSCSLPLVMKILSVHFGVSVLFRGLASSIFYSFSRSFFKRSLSILIDSFLFENFLSLTDMNIEIISELISTVSSSLILLPLEISNVRMPTEKKYNSILSCLAGMYNEEGGIFCSVYRYLGLSTSLFYLSSSVFGICRNFFLSKLISVFLAEDANISSWVTLAVSICLPFLLDGVQVAIFQPFHISRLRLMAQFRPPQNKLFVENNRSSTAGASLMPFYYWSGISPSSNAEPILVRRLSVVRPFIVGTYLSPKPYHGLWDTIFRIYNEEGLKALYSGWRYRLFALSFRTLTSLISIEYDDDEHADYEQYNADLVGDHDGV